MVTVNLSSTELWPELQSAPMAAKPSTPASAYSEGSIRVLKGLEPVKQRPGMYTRTDNPLHILQEVIDNAADEALAGFGKKIKLTLHTDGSVSVEDDGRGIPFGLHPEEGAPVVELVFTRLHAGGKFDKGNGGAYSFSGGLHGVGVSVTNALSTRLEVTVFRDGKVASLTFSGGDVIEPLSVRPMASGDRKQGTTVRAWPDAKYFDSPHLPMGELVHLLRSKAVLMPGVSVTLTNEKNKDVQQWQYKGGLKDYLSQTLVADPVIPLLEGEGFADKHSDTFSEGEGAAWCLAFTELGAPVRESYVNLIPTTAGGTHESGLRDGLPVRTFAVGARARQPQHRAFAVQRLDRGHAEFSRLFHQHVHAFVGRHCNGHRDVQCHFAQPGLRCANAHIHALTAHRQHLGRPVTAAAVKEPQPLPRLHAPHPGVAGCGIGQGQLNACLQRVGDEKAQRQRRSPSNASTASARLDSAASCPPGADSIRPTGNSPAAWQGSV